MGSNLTTPTTSVMLAGATAALCLGFDVYIAPAMGWAPLPAGIKDGLTLLVLYFGGRLLGPQSNA